MNKILVWLSKLEESIIKWDDQECYKCPYLYKDYLGSVCEAPSPLRKKCKLDSHLIKR